MQTTESAVDEDRHPVHRKQKRCLTGPARIGRVTFSTSRRTIYYRGMSFHRLNGTRFKSNYHELETGDEYGGQIGQPPKNVKRQAKSTVS